MKIILDMIVLQKNNKNKMIKSSHVVTSNKHDGILAAVTFFHPGTTTFKLILQWRSHGIKSFRMRS
mgnify:CR=1 FL=1